MENLMKTNIKTFLLATVIGAAFVGGCDGILEVRPEQSIDESQALTTDANVRAVLIGTYDAISGSGMYGGLIGLNADLVADDDEILWTGTFLQPRQIWTKAIPTDNSFTQNNWTTGYRTINLANNVLSAMDVVAPANQNRVKGEALFLRAAAHFELVRVFAKAWNDGNPQSNLGIPVVTEPTRAITEANNVGRNTVAEVYAQVIADLTEAATLLPEANSFYATRGAANALLSRVYLMQGNYPQAAQAANAVISSGRYSLVNINSLFNNSQNHSEDIFAIQVTAQDGTNSYGTYYAPTQFQGRGDIEMQLKHINLYEDNDRRLTDLIYTDNLGSLRTIKYTNTVNGNVKILRLAEMYLTRAEANLRAGTSVGATPLADINTIRTRAGLAPLQSVNIDQVLLERKLELMFEGHLLHDLKRTGRPVGSLSPFANNLVFPIPQREVDANPALSSQQNPGY